MSALVQMHLAAIALVILFGTARAASEVKYTELADGHVVNLGIQLSYSDNAQKRTLYNDGKPCGKGECEKPVFNQGDGSVLLVQADVPKDLKTRKVDADGNVLGDAVSILFKACFTKEFTKNRKWRKPKNIIKDDKRCKQKMGTIQLANHKKGDSVQFILPSDTPVGRWFITAYVKCKVEGKPGKTEVCAIDTTGGLKVLATPKNFAAALKISEDEAGKLLSKADTSKPLFYSTTVVDSRTTGLYVAVAIMSCISVGLLAGFFVYEQTTRKNK